MKTAFLRYFFRQAMANIGRNRLVHLIGVGTMVIAFLIFDAFVLIFVNLNYWIEERGRSLNMSIYFREEPDSALLENIKKDLRHFPGVSIKGFISKDEAMKDLRKQLGEKAGLLDGLEVNPLPASLEIVLAGDGDGEALAYELKSRLERIRDVDEVYYSQEWITRVRAIVRAIKIIGAALGGLLFLAALFIITNTIRLTIYSRKDEIEILKLVGATNGFVKTPFLIEGSIQGLLGGSGALMVLFVVYLAFMYRADLSIGFASLDVIFLSPQLILILMLMSTLIGFAGSMVSLGRFFRI
jgi:cell division transport system permease protein